MPRLRGRDAVILSLVVSTLLAALVINLALAPGFYLVPALYIIPVLIAAHRWSPRAVSLVGALGLAGYLFSAYLVTPPIAVWLYVLLALGLAGYLAVRLAGQRDATARSARELEEVTARLRGVQVVTEAALAHLSLSELLPELLGRIRRLLAVDTVAILLVDGDAVVPCAATGLDEEVQQPIRIPIGQGFAGRIAAERRPIIIDDVDRADLLTPLLREKGIRSLLGVPLLIGGQVIGVLHVGTLGARRFTKEDVHFLQLIADRAALAIDHARLYEAERTARAQAEMAARLRDEFLSVAAHELKTPVTSLRAFAQLVLRELQTKGAPDPVRLQRALRTIDRQSGKLSRLISQLLDVARLEAGRLAVEPELVDVTEIVEGVVQSAQPTTTTHTLEVRAAGPVLAWADPVRLEQVITNLIDNAIRFSPRGGSITAEVSSRTDGTICLSVTDQGVGIPHARREWIFDRFHQGDPGSYSAGLGLGLYVSRQIVELHGGTIDVESPPDGGSRFVVTLPAHGARTPPARTTDRADSPAESVDSGASL